MWQYGADLCKLRNDLFNFLKLIDAIVTQNGKPDQRPFLRALCIENTGKSWNQHEIIAGVLGENAPIQNGVFRDDNLKVHSPCEESVRRRFVRDQFGKETGHKREVGDSRQGANVEDDVRMVRHMTENLFGSSPQSA